MCGGMGDGVTEEEGNWGTSGEAETAGMLRWVQGEELGTPAALVLPGDPAWAVGTGGWLWALKPQGGPPSVEAASSGPQESALFPS